MKKKFAVSGMTCAVCQGNVDRAVRGLSGVKNVNVSLLSKSMVVEYDEALLNDENIASVVESVGYGCEIYVNESVRQIQEKRRLELRKKRNRLLLSIGLLLGLMVFSMGPMIGPVMDAIDRSGAMELICFVNVLAQILFLIPILILNRDHFIRGYKSLFKLHPNMDALVALGSTVSTVYGLYVFGKLVGAWAAGDSALVMECSMNLYFEGAAMIPVFISIGKYFEAKATQKTTASIVSLMELTPDTALLVKNAEIVEVSTDSLQEDDVVLVKPGLSIPTDGIIVEGNGSVDESAITGESMPRSVVAGDLVIGATVNRAGSFQYRVTNVGKDSTIGKIVSLVEEASESKAPMARLADRISSIFVPSVIGIALIVFILWMILSGIGLVGQNRPDWDLAIQLSVSVLVISCPCALGLATPVAIMVGTGKGAENGILIKSAEAFERMEGVDVVLFDKTGTLTKGNMAVRSLIAYVPEEELLKKAASVEFHSEHPLSRAIVEKAKGTGIDLFPSSTFASLPGLGVEGDGVFLGNGQLMEQKGIDCSSSAEEFSSLSNQGLTVLYVGQSNRLLGMIAIGDSLKDNAKEAIRKLTAAGKEVAILTGDNSVTAGAIAKELGVSLVYSQIKPDEKESIVASLQSKGKRVAMVGDGVNDAPALMKADVGIAIGAGTDIAIESSDIILVRSDPMDVVSAIALSRKVVANIKENLSWAFFYNIVLIPLAAGALYGISVPPNWFTGNQGHIVLTPMIASMAMSISSVTVVLNALRLRLFKRKD